MNTRSMAVTVFLTIGSIGLLTVGAATSHSANAASDKGSRPNILLIVADDLGYSDLSVYGSEIPTPNLDALAREGMMLTDFHSGQTCSPTRAMLMSGTDSHIAGKGAMELQIPATREQPGYEGYLNSRVASLASLLSDAGYNTYATGKWHLGGGDQQTPRARGFKRSWMLLGAAGGHVDTNALSPPGRGPKPPDYTEDDKPATPPQEWYSTRHYTEKMIEFIKADRADGKPFFAYMAYTAPHWPLQAPQESIARFAGRYDEGYDALYQKRLAGMKARGFAPKDAPSLPKRAGQPDWNDLTPEQKKIEARRMEIYAAMVSDLDIYVGKVIDYLKSAKLYDRTLIVFMSDNGAEATAAFPGQASRGNSRDESTGPNSYENMGKAGSFIYLGPNWARASGASLHEYKVAGFEGGHRVPAFVHYPSWIRGGQRSAALSSVLDLMPTFLAVAQTSFPGSTYQGREVAQPIGKSLVPLLKGEAKTVRGPDDWLGWELFGSKGVRKGDWKLVWDPNEYEQARWHLYNVRDDLAEAHDLAGSNPAKLAEMMAVWRAYQMQNGVIDWPATAPAPGRLPRLAR